MRNKFNVVLSIIIICALTASCTINLHPRDNYTSINQTNVENRNATAPETPQQNISVPNPIGNETYEEIQIENINSTWPLNESAQNTTNITGNYTTSANEENDSQNALNETSTTTTPYVPTITTTDECRANLIESCAGPPNLNCLGNAGFKFTKNNLTFSARNTMGNTIVLNGFASYEEEEPWPCMTKLQVSDVMVSVDGSEYVSIDSNPEVRDGSVMTFAMNYSGPDKGYIDQKFTLDYSSGGDYQGYYLLTTTRTN